MSHESDQWLTLAYFDMETRKPDAGGGPLAGGSGVYEIGTSEFFVQFVGGTVPEGSTVRYTNIAHLNIHGVEQYKEIPWDAVKDIGIPTDRQQSIQIPTKYYSNLKNIYDRADEFKTWSTNSNGKNLPPWYIMTRLMGTKLEGTSHDSGVFVLKNYTHGDMRQKVRKWGMGLPNSGYNYPGYDGPGDLQAFIKNKLKILTYTDKDDLYIDIIFDINSNISSVILYTTLPQSATGIFGLDVPYGDKSGGGEETKFIVSEYPSTGIVGTRDAIKGWEDA